MVVTAIRQTSSDRLIVTLDEAEEIKTTLGVVTEHRPEALRCVAQKNIGES